MKQKSILLFVYGKVGYAYLASNLALSVKANKLPYRVILACTDEQALKLPERIKNTLFDEIKIIDESHYMRNGKLDKCLAKLNIWRYVASEGTTVFVDADSLFTGLGNIDEIFDTAYDNGLYFNNVRFGGVHDKIAWGGHVYNYSKIFERRKETGKYVTQVSSYILGFDGTFPMEGLLEVYNTFLAGNYNYTRWQNNVPDELIYQLWLSCVGWRLSFEDVDKNVQTIFPDKSFRSNDGFNAPLMTFVGDLPKRYANAYFSLLERYSSEVDIPVPCKTGNKGLINMDTFFNSRVSLFD